MDWSLVFSTLAWWEWAAYFFAYASAFSFLIWLLWQQKKEHSKIGKILSTNLWPRMENQTPMPTVQQRGQNSIYIATTLALLVGIAAGYLGTKFVEASGPQPMYNVLITAQHEDGSYTMLSDNGIEFETFFCHGRDNLVAGNKLVFMAWQQEIGCKNVRGEKLGYSVYTHKDGSRMIFPIPGNPKEQADAR